MPSNPTPNLNYTNPAAYLAALIECSDDAIISKDLNNNITSWNEAAERIYGFTADEAIGKPITIIIPEDRLKEEAENLEKMKRGERIDHYETVRMAKDGRLVKVSITSSPIYDNDGKLIGISKTARDITQQKEIEEKLLEKTHGLERINSELEDITHIASHDLKEPLRGIIMKTSFLLDDYGDKLDEHCKAELQGIMNLGNRGYQLIEDILGLFRMSKKEFAIEDIDIDEVVKDIAQMMEIITREKNAKIIISKGMPHIRTNRTALTEILRNLIINGISYNDKPEPVIEIGYLRTAQSPHGNEKNVFYVRDNGIGIEPRFQSEIFRLFKRLATSKNFNRSGTGIGLTLVKNLVDRCQGHIWLESEMGKGSTFFFTLKECTKPEVH